MHLNVDDVAGELAVADGDDAADEEHEPQAPGPLPLE
jgi:hypothetical protein